MIKIWLGGSLLIATTAIALPRGSQHEIEGDPGKQEISYEEALSKCDEFNNDPQIVKIEFKTSCFREDYSWEESEVVDIELPNKSSLGFSINMKEKYEMPDLIAKVPIDNTKLSCPVYRQMVTSYQTELVLSCNEFFEEFQNPEDLAKRCDQILDEVPPSMKETGRYFSPCQVDLVL